MTKERYELDGWVADNWAEPIAWKRTGFKSFDDAKQQVRAMTIEEKVELLTELNIDAMATMHFRQKNKFLRKLGHKTWIDAAEVLDHVKETYVGDSTVEWHIDEYRFSGKWISPLRIKFETVYQAEIDRMLKDDKNE